MSARKKPPENNDNTPFRPSGESRPENAGEAVSGVKKGVEKATEGGSEAIRNLLLLILLLAKIAFDDDEEDDELTEPEERAAAWDERANPIQDRFEQEDVDEDDVGDAIEWARSQ